MRLYLAEKHLPCYTALEKRMGEVEQKDKSAGLGITLLSASVQQFQRPGVVYRTLQPSTPKVALALAWRRDDPSAVLQAFIEVVRECTHETNSANSKKMLRASALEAKHEKCGSFCG